MDADDMKLAALRNKQKEIQAARAQQAAKAVQSAKSAQAQRMVQSQKTLRPATKLTTTSTQRRLAAAKPPAIAIPDSQGIVPLTPAAAASTTSVDTSPIEWDLFSETGNRGPAAFINNGAAPMSFDKSFAKFNDDLSAASKPPADSSAEGGEQAALLKSIEAKLDKIAENTSSNGGMVSGFGQQLNTMFT
jgi:hypothetical protein